MPIYEQSVRRHHLANLSELHGHCTLLGLEP